MFDSVHCFFCDAYEKREKTAAVLGLHSLDDIAPALMAVFLSQDRIMIYTNGDDPDRYRFQDHLEMAIARGCRLDTRRIVSVTRSSTESLMIRFECGPANYVNFLMYTPPTRNRAQNLISQLGIETAGPRGYAMPKGADGETNVRGCFVAGDTSSLNKTIAAALNSGK